MVMLQLKQIVAKNKQSFAKQSAEKADTSVQESDCMVFSANELNVWKKQLYVIVC